MIKRYECITEWPWYRPCVTDDGPWVSHQDIAAFVEATGALFAAAKASGEAMEDALYEEAHLGLSLALANLTDALAAHPLSKEGRDDG